MTEESPIVKQNHEFNPLDLLGLFLAQTQSEQDPAQRAQLVRPCQTNSTLPISLKGKTIISTA